MSMVTVTNCSVLRNPAPFHEPLEFEVTFDCAGELAGDLEWSLVYVASAEDSEKDQCLEELLVGPVQVGTNRFTLQAPAPDLGSIKPCDLLGVTVVLITGSYCGSEFIRIGYYVNNSHSDPEVNAAATDGTLLTEMQELPPGEITRSILADKPRVTRFLVDWNKGHQLAVEAGEYMMEGVEDDAETSGELSFSSSQATKGLLDYAPTGVHSGEVMMDVMEVRY